jgi:hypothetical protein
VKILSESVDNMTKASVLKNKLTITYIDSTYMHTYTYHSRFISEGVAEASQIFLRDVIINK